LFEVVLVTRRGIGHLVWMTRRLPVTLALAVVALAGAGCSSDMAGLGDAEGGQTGSLVPPCLVASPLPYVVPEGDTAFAQQSATGLPALTLIDEDGRVVPTRTTTEGETSVVHTLEVLEAGTYTISSECQLGTAVVVEREITVVDAAPLPTEFGELALQPLDARPECSAWSQLEFTWTPPPEFLPYLGLTQLTLHVDGGEVGPVALDAPLAADADGVVRFRVPTCPEAVDTCGPAEGKYSFRATIAGEDSVWTSSQVNLNGLCIPTDGESIGCSMRPNRPLGVGWWLLCASMLVWRRRGRHTLGSNPRTPRPPLEHIDSETDPARPCGRERHT
jgi:hypothetical protein